MIMRGALFMAAIPVSLSWISNLLAMIRLIIILLFTAPMLSCGEATYQITAPRPTLELSLLQDNYVVEESVYLQLRALQTGYEGSFKFSVLLQEGACDVAINTQSVPTAGEWVSLSSPTEILTITPRQTGTLRLSFELRNGESQTSDRSTINLRIAASAALRFEATCPQTASITKPVQIAVMVAKAGSAAAIPVKFEQLSNTGSMQYGAVAIPSGGQVSVPANSTQTFYYTPSERGIHKFQLTATDGHTTEFRTLEIIITN